MGWGVALGIIGNFWSAYATRQGGLDARRSYFEQANIIQERARLEAIDVLEEGREVSSGIMAETAASGFEFTGSPYMAMMESLNKAEEDAARIKEYAAQEAEYLRQTGRAMSDAADKQAIATILGAGGQAFSQGQALDRVKNPQGTGGK